MKPRFSLGDAIAAPFILIRQRPFSVLVWGLLMIGVGAAIYSLLLPILFALPFDQDPEALEAAYLTEMIQLQAASNGLSILMYLIMLVVFNAAGRAVLAPGSADRFLFMRLGMDEVRVAVVVVACFLGWYVGVLVLVLLGVALGFGLWAVSETAGIVGLIVYGILAIVVVIVLWVRLSLMGPATLILGRFAFEEGWVLSRGQVLKLIGMQIVVWVIQMLVYLMVFVAIGAILAAGFIGQGLSWPEVVESPRDLLPLVRPMIAPALLALLPLSFAYGVFIALMAAPSIRAARQLLDGTPSTPRPIGQDAPPADTLSTP